MKINADVKRFIARHYPDCLEYLDESPATVERAAEAEPLLGFAMRAIADGAVAENRGLTENEQAAWDAFSELHNDLRSYLDKPVRQYGGLRSAPTTGDREFRGAARRGEVFTDRDGRETRLLRRGESYAEAMGVDLNGEYQNLSLGGCARSLITGARTDAERRALSEATPSAGGYTVPSVVSADFIERLMAKAVIFQAGSTVVPMTSMTQSIARVDTGVTAYWRSEAGAATPSSPTFSPVTLTARSLMALVVISRELLEDSLNIERVLNDEFVRSFDLEMTRVALHGSGTPPEPQGLRTLSGVAEVTMGAAAGGTLADYTKLLSLAGTLASANSEPITAMVMSPREFFTLAGLRYGSAEAWMPPPAVLDPIIGAFQWQSPKSSDPVASRGRPLWLQSGAVKITEDFGTGSPMRHDVGTIFMGDFSELYVGIRHGIQLQVLPELYAANHQVGFKAFMRMDIQVAHPASFGRLVGIRP